MLGLGLGEILVMAAIALVVVGPERLPKLMRELGRWYGQLRRAADDLRRAFVLEADRQDASDRYRKLQERRREAMEARKKAQAEAGDGTVAQEDPPVEGPEASPEAEGAADDSGSAEPVPNDLPPDAPHPEAMARADAERRGEVGVVDADNEVEAEPKQAEGK